MSGAEKVCQFFASDEGCKFGAACNFSHDVQVVSAQVQPPNETQDARGGVATGGGRVRNTGTHRQRVYLPTHAQHRHQPRLQKTRPCRYFQSGHCSKGDDCTFLHEYEGYEPKPSAKSIRKKEQEKRPCKFFASSSGCRQGDRCTFLHVEKVQSSRESTKVCQYFMTTGCRLGDDCRSLHPVNKDGKPDMPRAVELGYVDKGREKKGEDGEGRAAAPAEVPNYSEEELARQRNTEIEMLKKRYPQVVEVESSPGKAGPSYRLKFIPTDPDWPYDVKELPLLVSFPALYPKEMMDVAIPEDSDLPETVRRCVAFSLEDWLTARFKNYEKKGRVEMVFRPFLRWLDRELEEIFTDGLSHYRRELLAKEAGIDIIPARHLKAKYNLSESERQEEEGPEEEKNQRLGETMVTIQDARQQREGEKEVEEELLQDQDTNKENQPSIDAANPVKKGTEVKIKDLQIKDNVGTVMASSIKVVVKCERCKHEADVSTPSARVNALSCAKCNETMIVHYRPAIMHAFSSILGYLDLQRCNAFDMVLMDCHFVANCLSCNKDHIVGGIAPGLLKPNWCSSCHSKMTITMESAQFRQLQPSDLDVQGSVHKVSTEKIIKNVRDPAIKEGQPLPNQGTCRHYKKSYRWLRFPCCGKAYPCDTCHDDNEKGDHEMKYANRMICGFCAREQSYAAERPCVGCGNSLTRRPTDHWEGGKGCRDTIRMSKTDDKKYSNLNKTVSRHAQAKAQTGKKNTKLRHS